MVPLAGIFPAELTALRAVGLALALILMVYAVVRRRSLRNADVLLLVLAGLALAVVTGTEVVNGLLSAFSFEKGNGGRILGLAVFAAVRWAWQREWAFGATAIGLMLVALLLPIVPWTIRNIVVLDRLVPISTGGGKALYVGTFYPADGEYQRVKAILYQRETGESLPPNSQALNEVDPTPLFDHVWKSTYPELERDSALGKIGKENFSKYFGEDPLGYLGMTARKVGRMWSSGVGEFMSTTPGRVIQIALVLLGIAGLVLLGFARRWWETLCLAAPIVLVTVVGAISLAAPRRNEILMTLIFPLAGLALSSAAAALFSPGRKWSH
jgi:hypothetical protein